MLSRLFRRKQSLKARNIHIWTKITAIGKASVRIFFNGRWPNSWVRTLQQRAVHTWPSSDNLILYQNWCQVLAQIARLVSKRKTRKAQENWEKSLCWCKLYSAQCSVFIRAGVPVSGSSRESSQSLVSVELSTIGWLSDGFVSIECIELRPNF